MVKWLFKCKMAKVTDIPMIIDTGLLRINCIILDMFFHLMVPSINNQIVQAENYAKLSIFKKKKLKTFRMTSPHRP